MIASGGLSGGLSSSIAGGNFWDGARQGIITSGLNHAMHDFGDSFSKKTDIEKIIKEYEKNEKTIYNNSIKAEVLGNLTTMGQLNGLVIKAVNVWLSIDADVSSPTQIISELSDALLALGIVATTASPHVKIAAGILKSGILAENLYLEAVNNYQIKPQIIYYAPNYAHNKGMMSEKQKQQYYKDCNCGGSFGGGGASGTY